MLVDNLIQIGNSDLVQALANYGQLYNISANAVEVSNGELLEHLILQDKKYLDYVCKLSEKQIFQNERIITQNSEIIALLKSGGGINDI